MTTTFVNLVWLSCAEAEMQCCYEQREYTAIEFQFAKVVLY